MPVSLTGVRPPESTTLRARPHGRAADKDAQVNAGRLLIIDDDQRHRESLAGLVTDAGHVVVGTGTGADSPALLDAHARIDLMLLDLNMPGMDGYEVLSALRKREVLPSVIVLTGRQDDADMRRLLQLGANDFLAKPYGPEALLASIEDVLSRRAQLDATQRLIDRLRDSDQLYRFLVEQSPDVIYTLDTKGRFTFVSASAEAVLGREADSLLGQYWAELFAPGERDRARQRFDERRTGDRATRNLELRLGADELIAPRWIQVSATGLYRTPAGVNTEPTRTGNADHFEGTYGIVRDVTEQRSQLDERVRLEAQLEQARRMEAIGQLAGGIAHDFNNILASIIGYTELAQMGLGEGAAESGYLAQVIGAGERARDLIAQLLNFSRSGDGDPRPVRIATEVEGVARMLRAVIPASVSIETETNGSDATVIVDPVHLQQVLLNLFINARDTVDQDGAIRVSVRDLLDTGALVCAACGQPFQGAFAVIEVADNGAGIAPELLRHLFEPLVTARPGHRGTGFGLTLIHNIVHRYGGHICVESARGKGTAFQIYLPSSEIAALESAPAPSAQPALVSTQGAHVAFVDDEASVANFLCELLEHAGHHTTVFNDPESALEWLDGHTETVDLVISDQTMPRVTGIELAARVAAMRPAPPVILCTGYGQDAAGEMHPGIAAVLPKPFEIRELLREVDRHLAAGATQGEEGD